MPVKARGFRFWTLGLENSVASTVALQGKNLPNTRTSISTAVRVDPSRSNSDLDATNATRLRSTRESGSNRARVWVRYSHTLT